MLQTLFFLFGLISLINLLLGVINMLYSLLLPWPKLKGWVCITGGSDGIGLGLSISLAKQGVNLILISRNKEKLENAKNLLKSFGPEIVTIQADLATSDIIFLSSIIEKLKKFPITGVINCAGVSYSSFFHLHKSSELLNMLNLHVWPVVLMSKVFTDAWIINVSSTAGVAHSPILSVYSATKAFIHCFSEVLASERKNVISFRCGFVDTEMTKNVRFKPFMISSSEVSKYLFGCIGKKSETFGHWKHWVMGSFLTVLPIHFTTMKLLHIMKKKSIRSNRLN